MSANKTWAQRTKEATEASPTSNLKQVGNFEPFVQVFSTSAPTDKSLANTVQIKPGDELLGIYEGFATVGAQKTPLYRIRTDKGLVGIFGSGQLNKKMAQVAEGAEVSISYTGKQAMTTGQYAGTKAHQYNVAASVLKTA